MSNYLESHLKCLKFHCNVCIMLCIFIMPKCAPLYTIDNNSIFFNSGLLVYSSRVSSVLNKDVQQYGKKYLFDNNDETCWCSDQSSPQWISLMFENIIQVSAIKLQFQGGFVGKDCKILASSKDGVSSVTPFYPEDINTVQTFNLEASTICSKLTLNFDSSTDFFGRIIVYKLDILTDL